MVSTNPSMQIRPTAAPERSIGDASFQVLGVAVQGDGEFAGGGDFSWLAPIFGQAVSRANVGRISRPMRRRSVSMSPGVGHGSSPPGLRRGSARSDTRDVRSRPTASPSPTRDRRTVPGGWRLSAVSLPTDQIRSFALVAITRAAGTTRRRRLWSSVRNIYLRSTSTDDTLAFHDHAGRAHYRTPLPHRRAARDPAGWRRSRRPTRSSRLARP